MSKVAFFDEMIDDMKAGIYDYTVDGKCSNCGSCCSNFLPISKKEIETIKKYITVHKITEQKHVVPAAIPVADWTCPFRSDTLKKCLIYKVRPLICREWQCDKPKNNRWANDALFQEKRMIVSMRQTFFNSKSP